MLASALLDVAKLQSGIEISQKVASECAPHFVKIAEGPGGY
jgi:hypothetical protein